MFIFFFILLEHIYKGLFDVCLTGKLHEHDLARTGHIIRERCTLHEIAVTI